MSDQLYEKLKETAIAHVRAFESTSGPTKSPFDPENVYQYRHPDCVMRFHPGSSMPPPFNGPVTRVEHEPAILMLGALMEKVYWDIHEVTVDVRARTVAIRQTAIYDFKPVREDPETRRWEIAYVWITEMDEIGEKIVRMEECLDTTKAGFMLDRAMKYGQENAKAS